MENETVWQCPKCRRWQTKAWNRCHSEYDTGIPCDGERFNKDTPSPQPSPQPSPGDAPADPWREAAEYTARRIACDVYGFGAEECPVHAQWVYDAHAGLRAKLERAEDQLRWRDVKTEPLPHHGRVIVWRGHAWPPYVKIGVQKEGGSCSGEYEITHWMPLPEPPAPTQENR